MKIIALLLPLFFYVTAAYADDHKGEPKAPPLLQTYVENSEKINKISIRVELGDSPLSGAWELSQTQMHVLLGKLQHLKNIEHPYDDVFNKLKEPSKRYGGLEVSFTTGERDFALETLVFYAGSIKEKSGKVLFSDPGRLIEYWLWGTAKTRIQQQIALNVLSIFAFDQCVELGHVLIETDPRQCLMPNALVMLDLGEMPTFEALQIKNFEQCLISGTAIIDSFPRRCMAAGGKLFAEPPRMPDGRPIPQRSGFTEF